MQKNGKVLIPKTKCIGMMSGTSLDGIDLSLAEYWKEESGWKYQMLYCKTYPYKQQTVDVLTGMYNPELPYIQFVLKENLYTETVIQNISNFLSQYAALCNYSGTPQQILKEFGIFCIGLHGHTVHHRPSEKITIQAGNANYIAAQLGVNVVSNFRQLDVFAGGQGAPLAPFGEQLFGTNKLFLNLGGVANLGYGHKGGDLAFCNMILNVYSQSIAQHPFDRNGELGKKGKFSHFHYQYLQSTLGIYNGVSLAREQAENYIKQIEQKAKKLSQTQKQEENTCNTELLNELLDNMHTFYIFTRDAIISRIVSFAEHQSKCMGEYPLVYCTGGGAYNTYLMQILEQNQMGLHFVVPTKQVVQFKQSLIFGLLALKHIHNEKNCMAGVGGNLVKGTPASTNIVTSTSLTSEKTDKQIYEQMDGSKQKKYI